MLWVISPIAFSPSLAECPASVTEIDRQAVATEDKSLFQTRNIGAGNKHTLTETCAVTLTQKLMLWRDARLPVMWSTGALELLQALLDERQLLCLPHCIATVDDDFGVRNAHDRPPARCCWSAHRSLLAFGDFTRVRVQMIDMSFEQPSTVIGATVSTNRFTFQMLKSYLLMSAYRSIATANGLTFCCILPACRKALR